MIYSKKELAFLALLAAILGVCVYLALRVALRPPSVTTQASPVPTQIAGSGIQSPAPVVSSPISSPVTTTTTPHEIQIRTTSNGSEFYDALTGARFIPQGYNYTRLQSVTTPFSPQKPVVSHVTFTPSYYDAQHTDAALSQMQSLGYNTIRVLVDSQADGNPNGQGLSQSYLQNVADFLQRAKTHHIFVIVDLSFIPQLGGYYVPTTPQFQGLNYHYLYPEALKAKQRYVQDFIQGLKNLNAPLSTILAYNIEGEQTFSAGTPPLNLTNGIANTNAGPFDLAQPAQKQQMLEKNLVVWINEVRKSILALDPTALVTIQFVPPMVYAQVNNDHDSISLPHWPMVNAQEGGSEADFISLSMYPAWNVPIGALFQNLDIPSNMHKPLLILEEGELMNAAHQDPNAAIKELQDWQKQSCQYHVQGWLHWTWDTTEQSQRWWTAVDANGAIEKAFSPLSRPNPCQ